MESTKIVKSIRKLKQEVRKRFRLYLLSPYFNRSKTLLKGFDTISKFIDKTPSKKITKEFYWKKVFGKTEYKEVNLRKLNSDLLRMFKDFLAQEQYQGDEGRRINYLMRSVHEWGIDPLKSISIRQSDKYFEETPYRNANYYLQKYTKEKEYYQLIDFDKSGKYRTNVEDILMNLDLFYLSEKLYFYTNSIVRKKFLAHDYQFFLIDEILAHVEEKTYDSIPAVTIFYNLVRVMSDIEYVKGFEDLKSIVKNNIHLFPREEINEIYTNILNYVVAQINSGNTMYYNDYFLIFKELDEKGFLLEMDGSITPAKFRNVTKAALKMEDFDWAEEFVGKYGKNLPLEFQESVINHSLALIHFRKKDFAKVVPLLALTDYYDIVVSLSAKLLLAHAYYELEEFDVLESHIDAFKVFLSRRKDIPDNRRKNYQKHLRYLGRLIRIMQGDKESILKYIEDLKGDGKVINTNLLLEKVERLRY